MSDEVTIRLTFDIGIDADYVRKWEMADMEKAVTTANRFFQHTFGELANGTKVVSSTFVDSHYGPEAKEILGIGSKNEACETCQRHAIDERH